jgi:hypothetical protein
MIRDAKPLPAAMLVTETLGAFRVDDANGQALGYFYFRDDENVARQAGVLTRDEAPGSRRHPLRENAAVAGTF